jgi:hypothetical protein
MKYRGKDIKTYLRHECIIPTDFSPNGDSIFTKKEMRVILVFNTIKSFMENIFFPWLKFFLPPFS